MKGKNRFFGLYFQRNIASLIELCQITAACYRIWRSAKKLKGTIIDEFFHQVKFRSTLTFAVADMSSDGFGVVLPGLKYNFHLTGAVPSQVPPGVAFRFSFMFTGTFRTYGKLLIRENLSFSLVLLFLNNIQIDVSSPKEKSQPSQCHSADDEGR